MAAAERFDADQARELRRRAFAAWAERLPAETPDGWSLSSIDPAVVVAAFPPLRIREGFALIAFQYRSGRDGNGVVWAVPDAARRPDPALLSDAGLDEPPRPPGAFDDAMEAIDGDGTAWSYFCASLCARELSELGAIGHGSDWIAHLLLDRDPWSEPPPVHGDLPAPQLGRIDEWEWRAQPPEDWRPGVWLEDDSVAVEFCTLTPLGRHELVLHRDSYRRGHYVPSTEALLLAVGPSGFVW